MKKSLVALAVLGSFAGAASAQSSVTIYGLLNVAVTKGNCATNCAANPQAPVGKSYQLKDYGTSRLGFRGTEDLGGGLSAQFQIEHRFAPDTGAQSNATSFWNGRSYVQLTSAGIGSVYMGREYTPTFWIQVKSDPFGNDGIAEASSQATYANYLTPDPVGNGARTSNTVGFKSASFGGLTAQAAVGLSEATQQGRNMAGNLEYAAGPIYAGLGYETVRKGTNDGTGVWNAAFHYDFGIVKAIGYYARSKTRTVTVPVNTNRENTNHVWMAGATAPLAGGLLKAMYYRVDPRFANNTRQKIGVGYDYFLSKRTNLYAEGAFAREDQRSRNSAYALGVKHTF